MTTKGLFQACGPLISHQTFLRAGGVGPLNFRPVFSTQRPGLPAARGTSTLSETDVGCSNGFRPGYGTCCDLVDAHWLVGPQDCYNPGGFLSCGPHGGEGLGRGSLVGEGAQPPLALPQQLSVEARVRSLGRACLSDDVEAW